MPVAEVIEAMRQPISLSRCINCEALARLEMAAVSVNSKP